MCLRIFILKWYAMPCTTCHLGVKAQLGEVKFFSKEATIVALDKPKVLRRMQWKNGRRLGAWNVRSAFRPGILKPVVKQAEHYKIEI